MDNYLFIEYEKTDGNGNYDVVGDLDAIEFTNEPNITELWEWVESVENVYVTKEQVADWFERMMASDWPDDLPFAKSIVDGEMVTAYIRIIELETD